MRNYELNYLTSLETSAESLEELSNKLIGFITQEEGLILKQRKPERRRLGHEIKGYKEVFITSIEFSFNPKNLKSLNEKIEAEKNILRKMITIKVEENENLEAEPKHLKESGPKKVELKEMDKKIDEILK